MFSVEVGSKPNWSKSSSISTLNGSSFIRNRNLYFDVAVKYRYGTRLIPPNRVELICKGICASNKCYRERERKIERKRLRERANAHRASSTPKWLYVTCDV